MLRMYESPLGPITISATERGVSRLSFSSDEASVDSRVSNAHIERCVRELDEYFSGTRRAFDVPLALGGTAFEARVWQALLAVPFGETCSYLDIANSIRNPKAIRAVGRANGSNPIGIIVPCHRVIGGDGSLVGYAGELWRKRWLLDHEARVAGTQLF